MEYVKPSYPIHATSSVGSHRTSAMQPWEAREQSETKYHPSLGRTAGGRGRRPDKGTECPSSHAEEEGRTHGAPFSPQFAYRVGTAHYSQGRSLILLVFVRPPALYCSLRCQYAKAGRCVNASTRPAMRSDTTAATPVVQPVLGRCRRCLGSVSQTIKNLRDAHRRPTTSLVPTEMRR